MNFSDFTDDVVRSVGFLSRIPMPGRFFAGHDGSLSRAVRAFPVAGLLIALPPSALLALLLACRTDPLLAALLALALQTMLTGALHEDGLSDTADGIGGGRDREAILRIMKDSRIGSYGAVALILSFAIRASALAAVADETTPAASAATLLGTAAASRAAMVWHWSLLPPARAGGVAASAGLPDGGATALALALGGLVGLLLLMPAASFLPAVAVLAISAATAWGFTRHVSARIGGHTGDTIGATQQLTEIMSLSALAVVA
ncbi:MAG: adenosylcobinamide-GDP ribazoletransferase [Rhizobiaceae bacterium]|nr:adenosylcobinamide-GDP ribazoletransferase [Rhizobiaceae bacterium]